MKVKSLFRSFALFGVLWCLFTPLFGQYRQYSQYMFNGLLLNPAYAGSKEVFSFTGLGKVQWVGLEGAPRSASLGIHGPSRDLRHGFGLLLNHDQAGPLNYNEIRGSYAFRILLGKASSLSLGLEGGVQNLQLGASSLNLPSGVVDPLLENSSSYSPQVGGGLFFKSSKFYFGVSSPHIFQGKPSSPLQGLFPKHAFVTGGAAVPLGNALILKPSFLYRPVFYSEPDYVLHGVDLNLSLLIQEQFWAGVSYRPEESVVLILEWLPGDFFRIGYAYDFGIGEVRMPGSGSHELMLGIDLDFDQKKMSSPRLF